jgi:hypothetical protein
MTAPVSLLKACTDRRLLGAAIDWYPAQRELLASLDSDRQTHIWAIGRQSGKSSMAGAAAVHNTCLRPDLDEKLPRGRMRHALIAAAGEAQARDFIAVTAAIVDASPLLAGCADVKSDRIDFALPRTAADGTRWTAKTSIRAMTSSSRTTRGLTASLLVLDEFAHLENDAALFAALTPSLRAFGALGRTLICSTPNGRSGKFFELFEMAQGGVLPSVSVWQASVSEVVPGVDDAWLDARRAELGDALYSQEYLAEFTDAGGSFFDLSEVEFADAPAAPEDAAEGSWVAALDPAFHADSFGVAMIGRAPLESDRLLVGAVESIKPSGAGRSFEQRRGREDATLERVWEAIGPYEPRRIVTDQHNSKAIESYFGRKGVQVEVVNLTRTKQTSAFVALRSRLVDGSLTCWREPRLVDELRRVRAKDTETVYLPRTGDSHCDAAAALALGVSVMEDYGGPLVICAPRVNRGLAWSYSSSVFG